MKVGYLRELDMTTEPVIIDYNANGVGDATVSDTYIEVTGLGEGMEISAVGYVLNSSSGVSMKFADISNIGIAETITQDGIYMILSGALERLELTCSGSCHLIIKQVI